MNHTITTDPAAAVRAARFGKLPERIRFEEMTEGVDTEAESRQAATYNPEGQWQYYSCLALDLGL
ncbi:hypothetical protein [Streptomyces sp. VRA16 Mangrove soil]|uniref:hypothetical protein n=1 Tax=Streptomyces sp. VRA16 Mangrove soil TaxID=2817434 RepID=UPI001A9EBF7F|nr:hypothetical protein [Streptomyces sp. VRA16 Mangrove soil]MBO1329834.1 hypothetical protein [Streptomyces sp. VRA16 Mangrove soil]